MYIASNQTEGEEQKMKLLFASMRSGTKAVTGFVAKVMSVLPLILFIAAILGLLYLDLIHFFKELRSNKSDDIIAFFVLLFSQILWLSLGFIFGMLRKKRGQ